MRQKVQESFKGSGKLKEKENGPKINLIKLLIG
jgi:hypothetical protein